MADLTYDEAVEMASPLVEAGAKVNFKWTCKFCGARPIFNEPNTIFRSGECCECGRVTSVITGYGLLVAFTTGVKSEDR